MPRKGSVEALSVHARPGRCSQRPGQRCHDLVSGAVARASGIAFDLEMVPASHGARAHRAGRYSMGLFFRLMGCRLESSRCLQPRTDLAKLFVREVRTESPQLADEGLIDPPLLLGRQQLRRIRLAALAHHRSCRGLPWDHLPRAELVVDALHVGERSLLAYA